MSAIISILLLSLNVNDAFAGSQTPIQLATRLCDDLLNSNSQDLKLFISPIFLAQRTSGTSINRSTFLQHLPKVKDCTLKNVIGNQLGNVIVVRLDTVSNGSTFNSRSTNSLSPRLLTFARFGKSWQVTSLSNFDITLSASSTIRTK